MKQSGLVKKNVKSKEFHIGNEKKYLNWKLAIRKLKLLVLDIAVANDYILIRHFSSKYF